MLWCSAQVQVSRPNAQSAAICQVPNSNRQDFKLLPLMPLATLLGTLPSHVKCFALSPYFYTPDPQLP